jgi:two-component system, chemotaxis family, chemotaxis protein CheY
VAKILLIEDDHDFRTYLTAALRRNGHSVMPVSSGRDLIERIGVAEIGSSFDVIVTDILMPDVDGLEVILAARAAHPECRIIAMSAGGQISRSHLYLRMADALGAQYTLSKPFPISELCDAVNDNAHWRRDH